MPETQLYFDFDAPPPKKFALLTPDEIFDAIDQSLLKALEEDKRLERKPASYSGSSLAEYLSMWANTAPDGGLMVMGVEDKGGLEGCAHLSPKRLNHLEAMQDLEAIREDSQGLCRDLLPLWIAERWRLQCRVGPQSP